MRPGGDTTIRGRTTEGRFTVKQIHQCSQDDLQDLLPEAEQVLALTSTLTALEGLSQQSTRLEKTVTKRLKRTPAYEPAGAMDDGARGHGEEGRTVFPATVRQHGAAQ